MKKIIKNLYYSIICYDPIIEILKTDVNLELEDNECQKIHLASPVMPNRKQKRTFFFEHIQDKENN